LLTGYRKRRTTPLTQGDAMTTTDTTTAESQAAPARPWHRMRLWATAHMVDDFFQGLVPAAVPYFVLERDFSYTQASGLALAATLGSALPQIAVGVIADRHRVPWLAALGIGLAGVGGGLSGLLPGYALVFAALLVSGLGVAMFHPPAGRDARLAAGGSASAMSLFAAGGSVGFFMAPVLVTPAIDRLGLGGTALFIPPAVLMAFVLLRHSQRMHGRATSVRPHTGTDKVGLFAVLTCVEVVRSTISFGINTFVALYWINSLGSSSAVGGVALALVLGGGVLGTLLGGRLADRFGMVRTVQLGNAALLPALVALVLCRQELAALPLALLVGLITNIPFAVLVKLGQDYLPTRPGTAAGVTLGLAVSAGGLFMPLLGLLADAHGTRAVLLTLAATPVLALALSSMLREPE
jgi:MFS transporter, FSR family, fosmidomycin resistance protein